ncbi:MAG: helix-turn-helix domain-containing protein [Oscillospiraceae bacterium]|nr:helix-turn-helix domain-containing protein [Oscillospiraceae bacterium]
MLRKNHRYMAAFKVPNGLITDIGLTYSAKRVGCALYSRRNSLGACRMSIRQLAGLSQCSMTTALKAVRELERFGYVTRHKCIRYSAEMGRTVYQKSEFTVSIDGSFTFVPHNVFHFPMKNSSFTVYLFLRLCAGNHTRAFPSLSWICNGLCISKSAVCTALRELSDVGLIHRLPCIIQGKQEHCENSYYFICNARPATARKTFPAILPIRKAGHMRTVKRISKIHIKRSTCRKLYHVSIIQRHTAKINTGG